MIGKLIVLFVTWSFFFSCSTSQPKEQKKEVLRSLKTSDIEEDTNLPKNKENIKFSVWNREGWGGEPDKYINGEDRFLIESGEYYYKRVFAKPTARSVELNSPSYMQSTCKINASRYNLDAILESMYMSVVIDKLDKEKNEHITSLVDSGNDLKADVNSLVCRPMEDENWASGCECVIYVHYKGGKEAVYKETQNNKELKSKVDEYE